MGAKSKRKYNQNQAKRVVHNIETILRRINKKYTPFWMIAELESAQHNAQCIQQEFERIMQDYGDSGQAGQETLNRLWHCAECGTGYFKKADAIDCCSD